MQTTHLSLPAFTVNDLDDVPHIASVLLGLLPGIGIAVADTDLRVRLLAGEVPLLQGMSGETVAGRLLAEVLPPEAWEALAGQWASALRGDPAGLDWASLDGISDDRLHFAPLRTPDGEVVGAAMLTEDISDRWEAYRKLEHRIVQQSAIVDLGSLALRDTPTSELITEAVEIVKAVLGAEVAAVLPYVAAGGLDVREVSSDAALLRIPPPAPAQPSQILDHMREANEPLLVADFRESTFRAPVLEAEGILCLAVAAIGPPSQRYGLLGAGSQTAGRFSEDDLSFLQATANVLAEAVEREREAAAAHALVTQLHEAQRLAGMGSWELDLSNNLPTLSDPLREMLGLVGVTVDRRTLFAHVHDDDREPLSRRLASAMASGRAEGVEFRVVAADGSVRLLAARGTGVADSQGRTSMLRGTVHDITEARAAEAALRLSEERFRQGFDGAPIGLSLADAGTGRYQRVNAAFCLMVGRTAEELAELSTFDLVHPDDLASPERAAFTAGRTPTLVTESRYLRPDGTTVWASINVSKLVGNSGEGDVLYAQALDVTDKRETDLALRRELDQAAWVQEIHAALSENRFELFGQPILDMATDTVVHHELLLRMRTPAGEIVAPGEFLPAAERYGVIRDIDRWVVGRGAELAADGMTVGINLSGTSVSDVGMIAEIDRALERTGADPRNLIFEITETALIESVENARRLAENLRERGCRLALDDFGTGFAGLSSLKGMPLDFLKIDQEFVRDLCSSDSDKHVVAAVIELARGFGLQTIAEGVEDKETLELLRGLGADQAQGYYLGRPAPIESAPSERAPDLLLSLVRRAIDDDHVVVCGQPIVDLASGESVKVELSLHLPVADGTLIPPWEYRAVVERFGLSAELGDLMLRHALVVAQREQAVAVDVALASLRDPDMVGRVEQALLDAAVDPSLLSFELTEEAMRAAPAAAAAFVERVHALGCTVTVEELGDGEGGYGFLKHLAIDGLKLRAALVTGLCPDSANERLIQSLVQLADSLQLTIAADGIDSAEVLAQLEELGIAQGQGCLLGPASPDLEPSSGVLTVIDDG